MTLIVGLLCHDGVVVASDSAATLAAGRMPTLGHQWVDKIQLMGDHGLYAATGSVGISQLVHDHLARRWTRKDWAGFSSPESAMDKAGKEICALVEPYLRMAAHTSEPESSRAKSLVAVGVKDVPCLFQFAENGAPELATPKLPFVTLGSGQPIADPFLAFLRRLLWPDRAPSVAEGRFAAVWTIDHTCQTAPFGVGGTPQLAWIERKDNKVLTAEIAVPTHVEEHRQRVAEREKDFPEFIRTGLRKDIAGAQAPPPSPGAAAGTA